MAVKWNRGSSALPEEFCSFDFAGGVLEEEMCGGAIISDFLSFMDGHDTISGVESHPSHGNVLIVFLL